MDEAEAGHAATKLSRRPPRVPARQQLTRFLCACGSFSAKIQLIDAEAAFLWKLAKCSETLAVRVLPKLEVHVTDDSSAGDIASSKCRACVSHQREQSHKCSRSEHESLPTWQHQRPAIATMRTRAGLCIHSACT